MGCKWFLFDFAFSRSDSYSKPSVFFSPESFIMSGGFSMLMEDGTIEYHGDGDGPSAMSLAIFARMQQLMDQRAKEDLEEAKMKEAKMKEEKTDQNAAKDEQSLGSVTAGNGAAGSSDGLPLDIDFMEAMEDESVEKEEEKEEKGAKKKRRSNPSKRGKANKGKK